MMKEKGVFFVTTNLAFQGSGCSDLTSADISPMDWNAFRLLARAGYTIVLFTSDRTAVYAERQIGREDPHDIQTTFPADRQSDLNNRFAPLFQATASLDIDLSQSWMVSDRLDHIEVGRLVGCKTVFLPNGSEMEWEMTAMRWPDLLAGDMWEIACLIVMSDGVSVESLSEEADRDD
jgi:phosphoglycolate phosphatase-like HAD superfamily hydrolase